MNKWVKTKASKTINTIKVLSLEMILIVAAFFFLLFFSDISC